MALSPTGDDYFNKGICGEDGCAEVSTLLVIDVSGVTVYGNNGSYGWYCAMHAASSAQPTSIIRPLDWRLVNPPTRRLYEPGEDDIPEFEHMRHPSWQEEDACAICGTTAPRIALWRLETREPAGPPSSPHVNVVRTAFACSRVHADMLFTLDSVVAKEEQEEQEEQEEPS